MAPPRSRRSTRPAHAASDRVRGSSALAEIDPRGASSCPQRRWLLRARGDRPRLRRASLLIRSAPPRSRRSTLEKAGPRGRRAGSSALAEIDPRACRRRAGSPRLLRARGDRPDEIEAWSAKGGAPPRSRRSTHGLRRGVAPLLGSSALAEIDPRPHSAATCSCRLLRARGDRPPGAPARRSPPAAPPRSRRSTRGPGEARRGRRGSSALAEIDPSAHRVRCARGWLLRARGDRPLTATEEFELPAAPPRSRRSTRREAIAREREIGSSALAEIDP